jgi:hypothetical protein
MGPAGELEELVPIASFATHLSLSTLPNQGHVIDEKPVRLQQLCSISLDCKRHLMRIKGVRYYVMNIQHQRDTASMADISVKVPIISGLTSGSMSKPDLFP